ncbi:hypothetical protein TNCV_2572741 [Trichonephila clavipes]|nr:hypothetical protein TNCV_2572741 [Trichonephila clavipes]
MNLTTTVIPLLSIVFIHLSTDLDSKMWRILVMLDHMEKRYDGNMCYDKKFMKHLLQEDQVYHSVQRTEQKIRFNEVVSKNDPQL